VRAAALLDEAEMLLAWSASARSARLAASPFASNARLRAAATRG
jgi:hypothetical protein